jgi:hypothetical protein
VPGNNPAEVRVLGGGGRLEFGDFVIHCQVEVWPLPFLAHY